MSPAPPGNPIALVPALGFLAFVAIAAVVARWAQGAFGEQGIAILLFLMGSMDVDASIVTAGGLAARGDRRAARRDRDRRDDHRQYGGQDRRDAVLCARKGAERGAGAAGEHGGAGGDAS